MRKISNNETPEQRFKRVAEARTNAVLNRLRILANCADRQRYSYSEEDFAKIFSAINRQVREVKMKFNSQRQKKFEL